MTFAQMHGRAWRWLLPWVVAALILGGASQRALAAPAAEKSVVMTRRDGDITILPNGDVKVVETWEVAFIGGPFHYAYRQIPYHRLESVTDWQVAEAGRPYTFTPQGGVYTFWLQTDEHASTVQWFFPETTSESRTFTLTYVLHGVLWLDEAGDRLLWNFLEADRGYPVAAARVVVHLPAAFPRDQVNAATFRNNEPQQDEVTWLDDRTVVFQGRDFADGEAWDIGVYWPHGAVQAEPPVWQREAQREVVLQGYQGDFVLDDAGQWHVQEIWDVAYHSGPFSRGEREVRGEYLDEIRDWQMSIDGHACREAPYDDVITNALGADFCRFGVTQFASAYRVAWVFPETSDAARTFRLAYTVSGAIVQDKPQDALGWWLTPGAGNMPYDAVWRVRVPAALASVIQVQAEKLADRDVLPLTAAHPDAQTWVWRTTMTPDDGARLRLSWPHGAADFPMAAWQRREQTEHFSGMLAITLAALLGLGGVGAAWVLWYRRGRDPKAGKVPTWLPEPPSALPPGLVGVLLDERADFRDVLAALWGLARRGWLHVEEDKTPLLTQFVLHRPLAEAEGLHPHEREILASIFGANATAGTRVRMAALRPRLHARLEKIYRTMYADVVKAGLFPASPEAVRRQGMRWKWLAVAAVALAAWGLYAITPRAYRGALMWILGGGALAIGLAFDALAHHLPRKTPKGALEAVRWQAFRRYLTDLKRFVNLESIADRFETYLPYATAFGLTRNVAAQFAAVPQAQVPTWYLRQAIRQAVSAGASKKSEARERAVGGGHGGGNKEGGSVTLSRSAAEARGGDLNRAAAGTFTAVADLTDGLFRSLSAASGSGGGARYYSGGGRVSFGGSGGSYRSSSGSSFSGGASGGGSSGFG